MDASTISEKNVTFDFEVPENGSPFCSEESSENLDWFGNETRKLHEKRVKREQRRRKKSLRTQILLKNTDEIGNSAVAQDKENEQPKKKRKVIKVEKRRVTQVQPFSFTLREERKKKEKENKMECSEDEDDDDICFKMPMRPKGNGQRKRQFASLSRLNEMAKPKMKKSVSDSSLPKPVVSLPKPKDKSKIDKILAKPKSLMRVVKQPTKAISPKFNLARRFTERRKREEILEEERKKQEEENKKIKEREDKIQEQQLKDFRQKLVHKPQKITRFKPVPEKATLQTTTPATPTFRTGKRRRE